ncbi:ABC-ATPase domain-containing protein [Actinomyces sp. oral taxon 180]|uniref:ABC-ATPase domain-containing protein n=1 Tax=Actinomyces sp. oral taxon 180 TaxID=651609 RepID=UPI0001F15A73|nr:ABC-ATPase domain-containing protein [Actinomyces sp. oral taxon 180]EFU61008.1 isopentenyl-diphosphate delta-isomerase [Actinomyces sp. oral taxon 180 str. F0310]
MTPRYEAPSRSVAGTDADLLDQLRHADGRPYGFYKKVAGAWDYGDFTLAIDHVQADPFAPPTALRAYATPQAMGLPEEALASPDARLAAADFLARAFDEAIRARGARDVSIARAGALILQRSYASVLPDRVEVRFQAKLPARGRTILGKSAARLFDVDVPNVVMDCFDFVSHDPDTTRKRSRLLAHIASYEDHRALQEQLEANGWVTFVADDSLLARRSGVSEAPLTGDGVVAFRSPDSLRASVSLPHAGDVSGMAIPRGLTLIVGGGYHGKSTLLEAIARGVYAHVPGDGRELVATDPSATKVRAADGRAVTGVDISAFISHLPGSIDTTNFSTENASGSTSQAASIIESLQLGARSLLIDEDTSATNLLIRDTRMRDLVAVDKEPITPLVDRVSSLTGAGTSLIMVVGGSGAFLDAADRVLMMDNYRCLDVTERAKQIAADLPRPRTDAPASWDSAPRVPLAKARVDRPRTKATGTHALTVDRQVVDISDVEAVLDPGQAEAIAWCVRGVLEEMAGKQDLVELMAKLGRRLASEGLDAVCKFGARPYPAFLARPRLIDVGAAINRYRGLILRGDEEWEPGES